MHLQGSSQHDDTLWFLMGRLEACMAASRQPVKQLPPPVQSYVQSVALPPSIAGRVPPTDARHAATPAVHAPLRGLTVVWHAGTEVCHPCQRSYFSCICAMNIYSRMLSCSENV